MLQQVVGVDIYLGSRDDDEDDDDDEEENDGLREYTHRIPSEINADRCPHGCRGLRKEEMEPERTLPNRC